MGGSLSVGLGGTAACFSNIFYKTELLYRDAYICGPNSHIGPRNTLPFFISMKKEKLLSFTITRTPIQYTHTR